MTEKKSHLPGESAFGGAIPDPIAKEFKTLIRSTGWKHKRAIAAAIHAMLKASKSTPKIKDSEAAAWYADVAKFYGPVDRVVIPNQPTAETAEDVQSAFVADHTKGLEDKKKSEGQKQKRRNAS